MCGCSSWARCSAERRTRLRSGRRWLLERWATCPKRARCTLARAFEFHDVKGVVEQVLGRFEMRAMYFDRFPADAGITPQWLHPYRSARVVADGITVGWFGQLHPNEAASRKIKVAVLIGEIYLDRLYKLPLRRPVAREISRYQPVRRDFSLVLDDSVGWERIDRAMAELKIPELVDWRVREVFRDAKLGKGEYALLLGATFQAQDRTLREEELQSFQARVRGGRRQGGRAAAGLSARKRIEARRLAGPSMQEPLYTRTRTG